MELGKITTRRMSVTELTPADYNPRIMDDRARQGLSNSIDTFGLVQPVIYNERTGNVVGGHQRLYDIVNKGVMETDVVVVDLPPSKEKALNIALNNSNIAGEFTDGLQDLLDEMDVQLKEDLLLDTLELEDKDFDPSKEWEGMPEFENEDETAWQSIHIHFSSEKAIDLFAKLINQPITKKTKTLWFPKEDRKNNTKAYVKE